MSTLPVVATLEPMQPIRLGTCLSRAFEVYTRELGWFIGWGLAVSALEAAVGAATAGWALLLGLALLVPAEIGLHAVANAAINGEKVDATTVLSGFRMAPAYVLGLLQTLLLVLSLLAFVFPVFIMVVALTWSVAAMYRRDQGALEAIKTSFGLFKDHFGLTVGVGVIAFLLGMIATGTVLAGAIAAPMMVCLITVAFEQINPERPLIE